MNEQKINKSINWFGLIRPKIRAISQPDSNKLWTKRKIKEEKYLTDIPISLNDKTMYR